MKMQMKPPDIFLLVYKPCSRSPLINNQSAGFQDSCAENIWPFFKRCRSCQGLTVSLWFTLSGRTSAGRSKLLVSDWSEEDVSAWLVEEGLEGLVEKFAANNIDGTELLNLTKETLASELHIGEERHTQHSAGAMPLLLLLLLRSLVFSS